MHEQDDSSKEKKNKKKSSDLVMRFRTGFVYITISVICLAINDATTALFLAATAGISVGEFYYMLRSDAKLPNELLGIVAAVLYPLSAWLFKLEGVILVTVGLVLALLLWYVFWQRARIADVGVSLFGALYTGLLLAGFMVIRTSPSLEYPWNSVLILGIFLGVWANDVFAYLIGRQLGKHKLAPRISPKKSWEGFVAGLIASMLVWFGLSFIPGVSMGIIQALVYGLVCGIMGVLGDLAESRIKRNSGFKDSGTLMPGHGGLLDRCDSLFLVSMTSALLLFFGGCISYV